jgi:YfiH family protein
MTRSLTGNSPLSPLLSRVPGVQAFFGTAKEPLPAGFDDFWQITKPRWKQVHGAACGQVRTASQELGEVDALWTEAPATPIAIVTADCVPILLARKDGQAVAAVHAGWRGTRARILEKLWQALRTARHSPSDWVAAIGPSIGPCCYEVSEELAVDFQNHFERELPPALSVPRSRHLDLPAINAAQLRALGMPESQVEILRSCTLCTRDLQGAPLYHSYRRSPGAGRQLSLIWRSPEGPRRAGSP